MVTHPSPPRPGNTLVTRDMVHERTRSLVLAAGRRPQEVRQLDYERAKRELTGLSDRLAQEEMLDTTQWPG
jgi:hypothetical protein